MARGGRRASQQDRRAQCERWFIAAGVPHFIAGYDARSDVLTRMARFLAVVFVLEPVLPYQDGGPLHLRVAAGIVSALLVLAGFVAYNLARGRPAFAPPHRVGLVAVAVFLLVPPLGALVLSRSPTVALWLLAANVVILVLSYAVTSYGVVPALWWAARQTVVGLPGLVRQAARSLPLLLIIMLLAFLTQEVWLIAATAQPGMLGVALVLLLAIGLGVLLTMPSPDLDSESRFDSWADVLDTAAGTPVADVDPADLPGEPGPLVLGPGIVRNLRVVQVLATCVQVSAVTLLTTLAFLVFGMLLLNPQTIEDITGYPVRGLLWTWETPLGVMVASVELVLAAIFAGILSGLQYIVSAATDPQYEQALSTAADRLRRTELAVLHVYRAAFVRGEADLRSVGGAGGDPPP